MSETVYYICHPEVVIDPDVAVPNWGLSETGFRRMDAIARLSAMSTVQSVWCSDQQKALDGAEILAGKLGLTRRVLPELAENDRSSTGYLAEDEFTETVVSFFGKPDQSVRGWETATHAQKPHRRRNTQSLPRERCRGYCGCGARRRWQFTELFRAQFADFA